MSKPLTSAVPTAPFVETTLGELAEYITSGSRDWSRYYADSGAIFIRTQDINQNRLSLKEVAFVRLPEKVEGKRTLVRKGDLLITITGANVGKVAVVEGEIPEAYVSQSVCLVRLKDPSLAKFVHLQLTAKRGAKTSVEAMAYGLGRPVLNLANIRSAPIRLAPEKAQFVIVAEIEKQFSRLDEAGANLKRIKAKLKRYKAAILKAAVEGKLTEEWRKANPDVEPASKLLDCILAERRLVWENQQLKIMPAIPKKLNNKSWRSKYQEPSPIEPDLLPSIPDSWTYASAEAICRSVRDGTHDTPGYVSAGVPLITSKNLLPSGLDFEHVQLISREDHFEIAKRSGVEQGDVLFAMIGTIGNPVVVETDREFAIKNVGLFKGNQEFLVSRYLRYWFMSPQFTRWLEPKQKGTTQKFVPLGLLRSLAVALPPLPEQQCIVSEVERRLSVIEELEATVEANLTRAARLRESILGKAFSGQLFGQDWGQKARTLSAFSIAAESDKNMEQMIVLER